MDDPVSVGITTPRVNVTLRACLEDDGAVVCDLICGDQELRAKFTGTDIETDVKSD